MICKFADCILDCDRHVLIRAGEDVHVEPHVFDLLRLLVENAGRLVTKDALVDAVWGGRIISEATISARINAARAAVGDTGAAQRIIKTVPRRGFELVAKVSAIEAPKPSEAALPRQTIRYATAPDGTSIAWSTAGAGGRRCSSHGITCRISRRTGAARSFGGISQRCRKAVA